MLSRGHLSRPACSHVKQIAKRPGTRGPGGHIPAGFFVGRRRASWTRLLEPAVPPGNPADPCRHPALAVRRDLGGAVPHPGLRLRERRAVRGALQRRGAGLSLFALLQSDGRRCSRQRMAALEGAEAARATASGMAAVTAALMGQLKAGDHVVAAKALFGSCRYVVEDFLPRFGVASTLVDGTDLDAVAERGAAQHPHLLPGKPDQSDARGDRHRGGRRDRARGGRDAGGRQRVRHAAVAEPARARRRLRRLFGHQAHRRPGPLPRRRHPRRRRNSSTTTSTSCCARPGRRCRRSTPGCMLKGLETLPVRVRRQTDTAATVSVALVDHPKISRMIYPGRPDHPQAAIVQEADARRLDPGGVRGQGRTRPATFRFLNALKLVRITNNLGDAQQPRSPIRRPRRISG